jgi:hypothetical protein
MHDPRSGHLEAALRILRYLKWSPGSGLLFMTNEHLNVDGYCDGSCLDDRRYQAFMRKLGILEKQEAASGLPINHRKSEI